MMKLQISLAALFILTYTHLLASNPQITGKIINEQQAPISFATVALYQVSQDTTMTKVSISDEYGHYTFTGIKPGFYYLEARFIGFTKSQTSIFNFDGKADYVIPTIQLHSQTETLSEIEITATRELVEVTADKTIFNVQGSINAAGNSAFELLLKSPGVMIDHNDNLILQGKSGVQLFIDGKKSPLRGDDLANFLQTLQSDEIEAIELITDPSAKYDAEGNAGIINIRLIKDISLGTNSTINLGYRYGKHARYNGSLNFNNRTRYRNTFGSVNVFTGNSERNIQVYRLQNGNGYDQHIRMLNNQTIYGFKLGTDLFLSKNHTIGLLVNGHYTDRLNQVASHIDIFSLATNQIDSLLIASNTDNGTRNHANVNINYVFNYATNNLLKIDLDYGRFRNNTSTYQPNTYYLPDAITVNSQNTFSLVTPTLIDIYTTKADWESNVLGGKLGVGTKISFVKTDNTFDFYDILNDERIKDINKSNNFVYNELVNAVYATFQKSLNTQWELNLGLRMEHTNSKGTLTASNTTTDTPVVKRSFLNLFPSAGLRFSLNEKNSFKVNYSRRVDRPNYQTLNPFEIKIDELTFRKGNPFLRPQYATSLTLMHTFNAALSSSLNYTLIQDKSTAIVKQLDANKTILTFANLTQQTNLALTLSYPFSVSDWWNVYTTVTGFRLKNEAIIDDIKIDLVVNSYRLYAQNTFVLPKELKVELSAWYNAPSIWGGNIFTGSQYDISVGVSKQLFKKKGNLKIAVSDIFLTNPWTTETDFDNTYSRGRGRWESRQVRFNFSYRFGSHTVKNARNRKTGIDDLKKRVNTGS